MAIAKRKKRFFEVEIPLIKKEVPLQAYEIEELAGRNIKYDMTRLLRGKGAVLLAKVKLDGHKASANAIGLSVLSYYIKRMLRTGTNYVEDSFLAQSSDAVLRIKPFLVTRRKVSRAVRKALREKCKEEILEKVKSKTTEEIFEELIKGNFQKQLASALKKVYPLALCEIRVIEKVKSLEPAQEQKSEAVEKTE